MFTYSKQITYNIVTNALTEYAKRIDIFEIWLLSNCSSVMCFATPRIKHNEETRKTGRTR